MTYPQLITQTAWVLIGWATVTAVFTAANWRRL